MRHPIKALNAARVATLKAPGRHADGGGLYLVVDPSGAKRWLLRVVVRGRRRDIGLGGLSTTSLAMAREQAALYRGVARSGGDPLAKRREDRRIVPTFEEAARAVHAEHKKGWRNPKHRAQWIATLEAYTFPRIGSRAVSEIETRDVLGVLGPIWRTKPETARRVRQRISTVLDWAKAAGHRTGDNPVQGVTKGLPGHSERKGHYAALPYAEVADFIRKLREGDSGEIVQLAFEFTILTAARTGETLGAKWDEIDLTTGVWTVPAGRMKAQKEHRVPLSSRCIEILQRARELGGEGYVFPGRAADRPLSSMALLMALRRLGVKVTVHGFRSAFRDWASEQTNFSREICEAALAHALESKVEAAYRRGDLLEKRRELMAAWATFALAEPSANVLRLRDRHIRD
jgi:integrase